jgi:hypothetical protein
MPGIPQDKALVFGLSKSGEIILHISEVESGELCGCVCPDCKGDLVAKKGPINAHHFAHAAGNQCANACETALHLFAKRAFAETLSLALPNVLMKRQAEDGQEFLLFHQVAATECFERALIEDRRDGFTPDAVGVQDAGETLIEFAYTHFVEDEKCALLKGAGLRAVEVDLRNVDTENSLTEIADEILFKAPRKWLWHPQWLVMEAELNLRVAEKNRQLRSARDQAQRAEAMRREETERQLAEEELRKQSETAAALAAARKLKTEPKSPSTDPGILATRGRVKAAYLGRMVGVPIDGDWIMAAERTDWQAAFVDAFLLLPRRRGWDKFRFEENKTVEWAERRGMLSQDMRGIGWENAANIRLEFPDFTGPRQVLHAYLEYLETEGVIARNSPQRGAVYWKVCENFLAEEL